MVLGKGFNTQIMYKSESAYGVQAGAVDSYVSGKIKSFTPDENTNNVRTQGMGEGRNETQTLVGKFDIKWTMEVEVGTDFTFYQYLIGTKGGDGSTDTPYYLEEADILAYSGSPVLVSFKMEVGSELGTTDDVDTYYGCVMNKVTFNFAVGQALTASIEGFARIPVSSTTATAYTANTDKVWMFQQGSFTFNAVVARVQSGNITIDNKYDTEENFGMGSRFLLEPQPNERTYDWSIEVVMTSTIATTLRDYFYGQANTPVNGTTDAEVTAYDVALIFAEGAAAADNVGRILLSDNFIDSISKPVSIGGGNVKLRVTGHGRKGTTDTSNKPFKWWAVSE